MIRTQKDGRRVPADKAREVAESLVWELAPVCSRIEIAGSLRRRRPSVGDVELLCIPKYEGPADLLDEKLRELMQARVLEYRLNKRGYHVYGPLNKLLQHVATGIGVDVFSTSEDCWAVALVVRTGGEATNIRIASAALRKGWRFRAYGKGFSTPKGDLVCRTEAEVFEAVGLPYKEPWERE